MEVFNLFSGELDDEREHPGFSWRAARVGNRLGAGLIGASLYELEPGERTFPYHFEWNNEEWLIVVAGRPVLRTPEGERPLEPGDVVCFPEGPAGAHLVRNDSNEPVRVLILSTKNSPGIAEYPDSDKLGVWAGETRHMVRRSPQLDYWDGES